MAASDKPSDESLYPIAVLIDELKNEDIQVCSFCHFIFYLFFIHREREKEAKKYGDKILVMFRVSKSMFLQLHSPISHTICVI